MRYFRWDKLKFGADRLPADPDAALPGLLAGLLELPPEKIGEVRILSRSLDARRGMPALLYSVTLELTEAPPGGSGLTEIDPAEYHRLFSVAPDWPVPDRVPLHPLVVGTGPAGIFAALVLAEAGCKPLILDRGFPVGQRRLDYRELLSTRQLNPDSNLLIGEGGAGAFSDGKLYTRTRDPRSAYILDAFVRAGAPPEIRYLKRPHIGSDLLGIVAENLRRRIEGLGGVFRFGCRVTGIWNESGRCAGAVTAGGERIAAPGTLLAFGLGGRELNANLRRSGVEYDLKGFQLGCRIEHPQSLIDRRQYRLPSRPAALGAAEYQFVSRPAGVPSVSTFCMCPGGEVVMASGWEGQLVSNGMSLYARDGEFANSALIVSVPADFHRSAEAAFGLLEQLERKAFALGGGDYAFPAQDAAAFLAGRIGLKNRRGSPAMGLRPAGLDRLLPPVVRAALADALRYFDRQCPGFVRHGKLIGLESCVSSPVRFRRHPVSLASSLPDLYLAGEGAGCAGGILSAAADGVKLALAMLGNSRQADYIN